jgi:hypothetical protein
MSDSLPLVPCHHVSVGTVPNPGTAILPWPQSLLSNAPQQRLWPPVPHHGYTHVSGIVGWWDSSDRRSLCPGRECRRVPRSAPGGGLHLTGSRPCIFVPFRVDNSPRASSRSLWPDHDLCTRVSSAEPQSKTTSRKPVGRERSARVRDVVACRRGPENLPRLRPAQLEGEQWPSYSRAYGSTVWSPATTA